MKKYLHHQVQFLIIIILLIISLAAISCGGKTTIIYLPAPSTIVQLQPSLQPAPQLQPGSTGSIIDQSSNSQLQGQHWEVIGGVEITAGTTLTLTWSADGSLDGYIFTANQYDYLKAWGVPSGRVANKSGSRGTLSVKIQNDDTYYGVVKNNATGFGPSVNLYEVTLTAN